MYRVGDLRDPRPDDPRFALEQEAWIYARKTSYPDRVLGVWDERDELVAIAYDGLVYWP